MEWPLHYYWVTLLGAPAAPMTWWHRPGPPPREPASDGCTYITALDLELVLVVYQVLVDPVRCAICDAPLDRAVEVELTRGFFRAARIVVTTHCRGLRRHRHGACVVEGAGGLRFGPLGLAHRH